MISSGAGCSFVASSVQSTLNLCDPLVTSFSPAASDALPRARAGPILSHPLIPPPVSRRLWLDKAFGTRLHPPPPAVPGARCNITPRPLLHTPAVRLLHPPTDPSPFLDTAADQSGRGSVRGSLPSPARISRLEPRHRTSVSSDSRFQSTPTPPPSSVFRSRLAAPASLSHTRPVRCGILAAEASFHLPRRNLALISR
jgi:hypothetical protein